MSILDFIRRNKKTKEKNGAQYVGRHQQVLMIKQILGEQAPALEVQIAKNKDLSEYLETLKDLEEIEEYMHSEFFTNQFDVLNIKTKLDKFTDKGYENLVLLNDSELEDRILAIYSNIIDYTKNFAKKNSSFSSEVVENLDKTIDFRIAKGFLVWITLGDLLKTGEEQHAWWIVSSLLNTNKKSLGFYKGDFVKDVLSTLSNKDAHSMALSLRDMKEKLLRGGKIDNAEARRVDELIEQGLIKNKKIHEQYPNSA